MVGSKGGVQGVYTPSWDDLDPIIAQIIFSMMQGGIGTCGYMVVVSLGKFFSVISIICYHNGINNIMCMTHNGWFLYSVMLSGNGFSWCCSEIIH